MQVRPGREPRGADIADRFPLGHALTRAEPAREAREVAVPGADAVRVSHLDQIPVAAVLAPDPGDDSVRRGPHRRPVCRREIDAFVGSPHVEDRMIPRAEPARDPTELQWCQKGAPQRDRKSTRLNSSHLVISYAVFCLKKKKKKRENE